MKIIYLMLCKGSIVTNEIYPRYKDFLLLCKEKNVLGKVNHKSNNVQGRDSSN